MTANGKAAGQKRFFLMFFSGHITKLYYFPGFAVKCGHVISPSVKDVSRRDRCHFQASAFEQWVQPLTYLLSFCQLNTGYTGVLWWGVGRGVPAGGKPPTNQKYPFWTMT